MRNQGDIMAKNSSGRIKLYGFSLTVGIILVSIGIAWATLSSSVNEQKGKVGDHESRIRECEKCIIEQTAHYKHIKEWMEKIEKKL